MSIQGSAKPLQDIKSITVECRHCHRTRLYTAAEVAAGNATYLPPSQCVCAEPTRVLLNLISQAKHYNLGVKLTLEF